LILGFVGASFSCEIIINQALCESFAMQGSQLRTTNNDKNSPEHMKKTIY
jgi:hypothetical protein